MSQYNKSIKGIQWNFIVNNSIYLIQIIQFVIVAKYLTSSDFGIVGIVAPILVGLLLMSDMGFGAALIQKQTDDIGSYASSILSVMLAISFVLGVTIIIFSEEIAIFYQIKELKYLLYYLALVLVVRSYSVIIVSLVHKNHDFKEESISRFISVLISFTLAICLAIIYQSFWALLISNIIQPIITIIYLNFKLKYSRVKLKFEINKLKEIYSFAFTLFKAKIIFFLTRSGIGLVLAKLYPSGMYGQYYFAQKTSEYPQIFFGGIINSVVYSALSSIQNNEKKFNEKFLLFGTLVTFFISPVCMFLLFYSQEIIFLIFGNQWKIATIIFSYFMFFVLISTIGSIPSMAIQAKGNANILLNANYIRIPFVLFTIGYAVFFKIDIVEIALLLVLSEVFPIIYLIKKSLNLLEIKFLEFAKNYLIQTIFSFIILLILSNGLKVVENDLLKLIITLPFAIIMYIILNLFFNKEQLSNVLIVSGDIAKSKRIKKLGEKLNVK